MQPERFPERPEPQQQRRLGRLGAQLWRHSTASAEGPMVQDLFGPLGACLLRREGHPDLLPIRFDPSTAPWRPGGLLPPPAGVTQQRSHEYYRCPPASTLHLRYQKTNWLR